MQASFPSTRLFLKTAKFNFRPSRQKSNDSTGRKSSVDTTASASSAWTELKQVKPVFDSEKQIPSSKASIHDTQSRESDETMREPLRVVPPFQGLPSYSARSSFKGLMDDDDLKAFGLTVKDIARKRDSDRQAMAGLIVASAEEEEVDDVFEMEVPIHIMKDKRPGLQVSIPKNRTPPSKSPRLLSSTSAVPTPPSTISTPSTLRTGRALKSATTSTPLSIVSPLSVMEMPKPKRPFSAESIEGSAGNGKSSAAMKSATSISSSDHSEAERNLPSRSMRSSMSSMASDIILDPVSGMVQPVIVDATALRFDATSLYHATLGPTPSKSKRYDKVQGISPNYVRRQASSTSLASTSTMNVNKPLPPEPGQSSRPGHSPLKHIAFTSSNSQPPSRSGSINIHPKKPNQNENSESVSPTSVKTVTVARRDSRGSVSKVSLRSKYTPKDLDAMDDAFQRKMSVGSQTQNPNHSGRGTPSQSQVSLALDQNQLHTITEYSPRNSQVLSIVDEPLQISRGPMRMEPSRRPPQPPQHPVRVHTIAVEKVGRRKPSVTRSRSSNQINQQPKIEEPPQRRSSTTDSMSKAERILGKAGVLSASRTDLRPVENRWLVPDSSKDFARTATPDSSSDDGFVPELEARPDAHFEEIRKRLELLSAKEDPSVTFDAFHEQNAQQLTEKPTVKVEPQIEAKEKRTIEEKLHLTGSLRNEVNVPSHIAELEAYRAPSPVELEGSIMLPSVPVVTTAPAELGLPSPEAIAAIPIPPEPIDPPQRRGRVTGSNPQSTASGKSRSMHSARSVKARSLASIAASDIPDIYASLPTPSNPSMRPSMSGEEVDELITADAAERVLLHILQSLDNLEDLFAASLVSKGFYRTFKRHELYLLKRAIKRMSPAAWELREMSIPYSELEPGASDYTPNLYFRHYVQDLLTMVELKAMIMESCKSFLRPETLSGLAGETERSPMIDEAFWRVWSFCRIFGCGNNREDDIVGQMDWLKGGILARQSSDTRTLALTDELARNSVLFNPPAGFAKGNGKGLSTDELYDMIEIWTCLGVLVRGYQGKRQEAREYGIYDQCDVRIGDTVKENAILEEWTHHLLTLAPSTVLDVTSPATPTRTQFAQARSQGYTLWVPPKQGASRSTFLKEAVSRVYEEKMASRRPGQSSSKVGTSLPQAASPSIGAEAAIASRARIARHAAEIRKLKEDPNYRDVPVSEDRPLSNYSDVLDRLEAISTAADAPPMPKLPGLAARLERARSKGNASVRDATMMPNPPASPTTSVQSSAPSLPTPIVPRVPTLPVISDTTLGTSPQKQIKGPSTSICAKKSSLKTPKAPVDSTSPSRHGAGRFSSLRGHITPKRLDKARSKARKQEEDKPSSPVVPVQIHDEKFPVYANTQPNGVVPTGPQVRDPVDLAVEKLVEMGFEEVRAKKALAQTESGNGINFESALQRLIKERDRRKRLERLETMG